MECSSANLMAGLKKKENTSASSLVPVPIVKTPVPIATKHVEAHAGSHDAVLAASVAMLRDEVRALREDLKEETRLRYKAETLLVRVVEGNFCVCFVCAFAYSKQFNVCVCHVFLFFFCLSM
jgi:glutamate racemase